MSYFSQTEKSRTPIKGLRQKVRTSIRQAGVTVKFSTDIMRDGRIAVISKEKFTLPFEEFEGRKVVFCQKA